MLKIEKKGQYYELKRYDSTNNFYEFLFCSVIKKECKDYIKELQAFNPDEIAGYGDYS